MSQEILQKSKTKMEKSLQALLDDLTKVRTGRASINMLDDIRVEYYGNPSPLSQVSTLNIPEPRTITIQPWDASVIPLIEKAILKADLGFSPSNDGKIIRINIPALTEERRKDMVKLVKKYAEDSRVALRHVRRDSMDEIKKLEKDKTIAEDEVKKLNEQIQKLTDDFVKRVDDIVNKKEQELLKI